MGSITFLIHMNYNHQGDYTMKKFNTLYILFALIIIFAQSINAKTPAKFTSNIYGLTQYDFRGATYINAPTINFLTDINYSNFFATIDTYTKISTQNLDFVDLYGGYKNSVGDVDYALHYVRYTEFQGGDTDEIGLSISYDNTFSPYITFSRDVDDGKGNYLELGITNTLFQNYRTNITILAQTSAVFDNEAFGRNSNNELFNNFYHAVFAASIDERINDEINLRFFIAYTTHLTDDSESAIKNIDSGGDTNEFYGGIGLTFGFDNQGN